MEIKFLFLFYIFLVQLHFSALSNIKHRTSNELIQNDIAYFWNDQAERDEDVRAIRNALKWFIPTFKLWNEHKDVDGRYVIQYQIENSFAAHHAKVIHGAMHAISENTCIRFENRAAVDSDEDLHKDWLQFQSPPVERYVQCYVEGVGRLGGANVVLLQHYNANHTCMTHKTVIHELFHKLGLWHEQSRYDRDHYITVNYENVIPGEKAQFRVIAPTISNNYGVEYDYYSVMHYDKKAFSKNDEETIVTNFGHPYNQYVIGKQTDASAGDYKKICSLYNCTRCMNKPFSTYGYNHCSVPKLPRYNSECDGQTPENLFNYEQKCCTHSRRTTTQGVWAGDCTCTFCVPASNCRDSDAKYFPAHFASNCCGRCGAHWLRRFCRLRNTEELKHWQRRGMCPDEEDDDTSVPVSEYSGQCNYCIDCEPASDCASSYVQKFPNYYEQNCCGRCGNGYIRKWCEKLPFHTLRSWQEKGYCPANVVPTTTTTTSPPPTTTTTTHPGGVSPSVLDERRNCDLCSPDRPDCVTSNETYFTQECCWHCGRDWFASHCNHLALTSAINLKSSLYLFIWRKFERCPMHELTPIAYRHFDGLDLNVDYKAAFCEHCKPKLDCETNFMKHLFARLQPHYYHRCCGYCSDSWQKQWCAKLVPSEKQLYRKFCPSNDN